MNPSLIFIIAALQFGQPSTPPEPDPVTTKIYNIQDLLVVTPNYYDVPTIDLQAALQSGQQGSQSPFRDTQVQTPAMTRKDAQELMNLIQEIVEPEAWGDTATMRYWNGNIIVKAPKHIHDIIR